jgi:hypothetical protein
MCACAGACVASEHTKHKYKRPKIGKKQKNQRISIVSITMNTGSSHRKSVKEIIWCPFHLLSYFIPMADVLKELSSHFHGARTWPQHPFKPITERSNYISNKQITKL